MGFFNPLFAAASKMLLLLVPGSFSSAENGRVQAGMKKVALRSSLTRFAQCWRHSLFGVVFMIVVVVVLATRFVLALPEAASTVARRLAAAAASWERNKWPSISSRRRNINENVENGVYFAGAV